jgi:DNA-binding NarL/FixJ family response regulator
MSRETYRREDGFLVCESCSERSTVVSRELRHKKYCEAVATFEGLTRKQLEVALAMVTGRPAKELAFELGISLATFECHKYAMYRRLGIHSGLELVKLMYETGFLKPGLDVPSEQTTTPL